MADEPLNKLELVKYKKEKISEEDLKDLGLTSIGGEFSLVSR
jgi:hypothetical protein